MTHSVGSHCMSGRNALGRLFARVLLVLMCLSMPAAAANYGGGSGTPNDPFLIGTPEEFCMLGKSPADWDKHFRLVKDIDLADCNQTDLHLIGGWVAAGSAANQPFSGIFDGDGKTISHFRYNDIHLDYVGLFQHVVGEIRNVHLTYASVIGDGLGTGALVGYLERGGLIGCSVTRSYVSGNNRVGALVGSADGNINQCWSDGEVSGVNYIGGLVGQVGGGTVAFSYSKALVWGDESVGGLIGGTMREISIVNSSYARGDVEGAAYVGGLVGHFVAGRIFKCYSTARVAGLQLTGGLIGEQRTLTEVLASMWDTEASGQTTSAGGTPKTTAEMKTMDTFLAAGWNFYETWTICEGTNYPVFVWQIAAADLRCPDGVSFTDFLWLAANWRRRDCRAINRRCDGADFDRSGSVDISDLAVFADDWLVGAD